MPSKGVPTKSSQICDCLTHTKSTKKTFGTATEEEMSVDVRFSNHFLKSFAFFPFLQPWHKRFGPIVGWANQMNLHHRQKEIM
jgi:hypothetical protein